MNAAQVIETVMGLPTRGSSRAQTDWARHIRNEFVRGTAKEFDILLSFEEADLLVVTLDKQVNATRRTLRWRLQALREIYQQQNASWWIEKRYGSTEQLIREYVSKYEMAYKSMITRGQDPEESARDMLEAEQILYSA